MHQTKVLTLGGVALAMLAGCSAATDGDQTWLDQPEKRNSPEIAAALPSGGSTTLPDTTEAGEVEVLNRFTAGTEEIEFIGSTSPEGHYVILIGSDGSGSEGVVDRLWRQTERLTDLETFHALAGRDAEPHWRLQEAHLVQVRALERPDDAVVLVDFQLDTPVIKHTEAQCEDFVYDDSKFPWVNPQRYGSSYWAYSKNFTTRKNLTGANRHDLCLSNNCSNAFNAPQVVGGCPEGSETVAFRAVMNLGGGWFVSSDWKNTSTARRYYRGLQYIDGQYKPFGLSIQGQNLSNSTDTVFMEKGARGQFHCSGQLCPILPVDSQYGGPW